MAESLRREDATARELAQQEFKQPVVLIAGAGTGKTTTLVRRLVTWAMGEGWDRRQQGDAERTAGEVLQRVVCITFTDKATLEMAARVHEVLAAIAEGKPQDWLTLPLDATTQVARARALIAAEGRLRVSTIHGFCQGLLQSHAMTAGLKPLFTVDSDGDVRRLLAEEVLAELMPQLLDAHSPALKAVLDSGHGVGDILSVLRELVHAGVRSDDLALMDLDVATARCRATELLSLANEVHARIPVGARGEGRQSRRMRLIEWLSSRANGERAFDREADQDLLNNCDFKKLADELNQDEQGALSPNAAHYQELAGRVSEGAKDLLRFDPVLLGAAREVLMQMLRALEEKLRLRGVVTFDDLLRQARDLLVNQPDLAAELAAGMDQLMVDEVQDTDPCQYAIVKALAFGAGARPALFVIGDPKQCIYTFRNADLAALDEFRAFLISNNAVVEKLSVNFRSNAVVLDEVSELIKPAMLPAIGEQPAFEQLLAAKPTAVNFAPGTQAIEVWDVSQHAPPVVVPVGPRGGKGKPPKKPDGPGVHVLRRREAAAVAEDIFAQNAAGTPWKECLVLLKVRSDQNIILEALRERGIPVQGENEKNWHRRREVVDAANALIAVLDHADDVALLGWLRSPMVGLPDAAVAKFWDSDCRKQLSSGQLKADGVVIRPEAEGFIKTAVVEASRAVAEAGLDELSFSRSVAAAIHDLLILRWHFAHSDLELFLTEFRKRTGCIATESRRLLGELRLLGVEDLLADVQSDLAAGRPHTRVVEDLRARLRADIKVDATMPVDPQVDAVRVMTVHKAKGLEANQVWICDVSRKKHTAHVGLENDTVVHRTAERAGRSRSCAFEMFDARSLGVAEAKAAAERREELEVVRLLYVAATRARHRLVISGELEDFAKSDGPGATYPLLDVLSKRHSAGYAAACSAFAGGAREYHQPGRTRVLWRHINGMPERISKVASEATVQHQIKVVPTLSSELRNAALPLTKAISSLHTHKAVADPDAEEVDLDRDYIRKAAAERGTLLHKALELWDASSAPAAELQRLTRLLHLDVPAPDNAVTDAARRAAHATLTRFASSELCGKFVAIASRIRAREFPLLARGGGAASGALIGTIDMLYEEPDGTIVVVDYKSDVCDAQPLLEKHRTQLLTYVQALKEFFKNAAVRAELWSFHLGEVVRVPEPR